MGLSPQARRFSQTISNHSTNVWEGSSGIYDIKVVYLGTLLRIGTGTFTRHNKRCSKTAKLSAILDIQQPETRTGYKKSRPIYSGPRQTPPP